MADEEKKSNIIWENVKFLLQVIVIPVVLAYFGFKIDNTLQEKQRAFDKIKFTDQVLNEAFDSNNAAKAFALSKLIPQLIDDKAFADTLIKLINDHYLTEAANALQVGDDTVYREISDAARTYRFHSFIDSLEKNPATEQAEDAIAHENRGLELIQQNKFEEAEKNFEQARNIYPNFYPAANISNVLKTQTEQLSRDGDTARAKKEVMKEVQKNYLWKLPPERTRRIRPQ